MLLKNFFFKLTDYPAVGYFAAAVLSLKAAAAAIFTLL
jgi:hypothetical protein